MDIPPIKLYLKKLILKIKKYPLGEIDYSGLNLTNHRIFDIRFI